MAGSYQRRLRKDLDRWIAAGWVAPERRADILASAAGESPRMSASATLGVAGAALLGLAVIAFVMANWDALPRLARLGLILALIWAGLLAALRFGAERPRLNQGASVFAALAFAAGLGLVGQMYNLPGQPWQALAMAALGGFAVALSTGAVAAAYVAAGFGVWSYGLATMGGGPSLSDGLALPDLLLAVVVAGVALSRRRFLEAAPLTHVLALLAWFASWAWLSKLAAPHMSDAGAWALVSGVQVAIAAGVGYAALRHGGANARIALGYAVWAGLIAFQGLAAIAFLEGGPSLALQVAHLTAGVGLAIWAATFGRAQKHAWVTAGGVVFAIGASLALLGALGLGLLQIAAIFLALAIVALVAAFVAARQREAAR